VQIVENWAELTGTPDGLSNVLMEVYD